jgi:hypothetical protein
MPAHVRCNAQLGLAAEGEEMSKPYPALCKDCKHSNQQKSAEWNLLCAHPVVNAGDPWALSRSSASDTGSSCREERQRRWFAPCGMGGKLWELKA